MSLRERNKSTSRLRDGVRGRRLAKKQSNVLERRAGRTYIRRLEDMYEDGKETPDNSDDTSRHIDGPFAFS